MAGKTFKPDRNIGGFLRLNAPGEVFRPLVT
jgi:hypothetical protein